MLSSNSNGSFARIAVCLIGAASAAAAQSSDDGASSLCDGTSPRPAAVLWYGDFDGDGLKDVVVIRSSGLSYMLRNRGDGAFENASLAPSRAPTPLTLSFSSTPLPPHQPAPPATGCFDSLRDQATANCLQASTTPTLGLLYPLSSNLFVSPAGNVGIATLSPTAQLHVTSTGTTSIYSQSTATSGVTFAGQFENSSNSGRAVFGVASAASGFTYGGSFVSNSPNGTGVRGETVATAAGGAGVYGQSAGLAGFGVYGSATNVSGGNYGVLGSCAGAAGVGVYGTATHASGTNYGVWGTTSSAAGYAGYFTGGRSYFQGSVGIGQPNPAHPLDLASGAHCTAGGVWTNASSRKLKENIERVDVKAVLEKVDALPIARWNYTAEQREVQHMGPMAEDFAQSFGLGDSRESIGTVDADGVALAAIQGLHAVVRHQEELIAQQAQQLHRQQEAIDRLVHQVEALETVRSR